MPHHAGKLQAPTAKCYVLPLHYCCRTAGSKEQASPNPNAHLGVARTARNNFMEQLHLENLFSVWHCPILWGTLAILVRDHETRSEASSQKSLQLFAAYVCASFLGIRSTCRDLNALAQSLNQQEQHTLQLANGLACVACANIPPNADMPTKKDLPIKPWN